MSTADADQTLPGVIANHTPATASARPVPAPGLRNVPGPAILGAASPREQPAGYAALLADLGIACYVPQHQTSIAAVPFGARSTPSTVDIHGRVRQVVPGRTAVDPSPGGQLLFALRHDGVDLEALRLVFGALDGREVERTIRAQPASAYARRLWFLYEALTEKTLDVPPPNKLSHIPMLDPERYVTCEQGRSQRHGVLVNSLGSPQLCPTIRRTPELEAQASLRPLDHLDSLVASLDATTAKRINNYLLIRESQGTFEIEGVTPDDTKDAIFGALLNQISQRPTPEINAHLLHTYQNHLITGPQQEHSGTYRTQQVWIGERRGNTPIPDYIAPQAADVPAYMSAFCGVANWVTDRAHHGALDQVLAGAVTSALFVYIHPFMDGNGRISRLLLQQSISRQQADGKRLYLPISSAIHRQQGAYYGALDVWSSQVMRSVPYEAHDGGVRPTRPTRDLYRYPDLTRYAEFIYQAANAAVTTDVPEEQAVLARYDRIAPLLELAGVDKRKRDLFFKLVKQNGWQLGKKKRSLFAEISDQQLADIEQALR